MKKVVASYFQVHEQQNTVVSVSDIAEYLLKLMQDSALRKRMEEAGRKRVVDLFDYREVAKQFVGIVSSRLGIQ